MIISTSIPYVNSEPHLGHLLEAIFNDTLARYQRMLGKPVILTMGLDQHGLKIHRKAEESKIPTKEFVDKISLFFKDLWAQFEITPDRFIETTSLEHKAVSSIIWKLLEKSGKIYKKKYTGLYCVGCEAFISTGQLLENGCCPDHKNQKPIEMSEENYFFKLSEYAEFLKKNLSSVSITPASMKREWIKFLDEGLEDISISRERKNLPWGIEVPGDKEQVMYVWFEALINYLTGVIDIESLEIQDEEKREISVFSQIKNKLPFNYVFLGKDIAKFHLLIFPAMMKALELPTFENYIIHGMINDSEGHKFSKSLGNGVTPGELVSKFGVDGARFLMINEVNIAGDTNFDWDRWTESYNTHLANNLGNVLMRITTLIEKYFASNFNLDKEVQNQDLLEKIDFKYIFEHMQAADSKKALKALFVEYDKVNKYLEDTKPWVLAKDIDKNRVEVEEILLQSAKAIYESIRPLSIFMPIAAEKINQILTENTISKAPVLFPKVETKK